MWPDWLKVIQLKPRFLLGLWLLGTLILFLPLRFAESFGIDAIRERYQGWIGFATLGAFAFWSIQLWPLLQSWHKNRKRRAEILEALNSLSFSEKLLLLYCIDRNQRTICLEITNADAAALCQKGLMERASNGHVLAYPHTIPLFVWKHLQELKPLILPEETQLKPVFDEIEHRLINLRKTLHNEMIR